MKFFAHFLLLLSLPNLVFAQSLDDAFSEPTGLSDQQVHDAQEFQHQGVKDRILSEECGKKDAKGACDGPKDGFQLEELISTAYAAMGIMPGVATLTAKEGKKGQTTQAEPKKEETPANKGGRGEKEKKDQKTDYCIYAATAGETIGKFMQSSSQQKSQQASDSIKDPQIRSLEVVRQSHKARQGTATFQASLYAGVTLCYGAMMWKGGAAADWKLIAKMAGAGTLATLYGRKIFKHKDAAEKVGDVIRAMEKADKCDPWTKTPCFCSEASSKELYPVQFEEVCVLNKGDSNTPKMALACVSQNGETLKEDPNCQCKLTNSCARNPLKGLVTNLNPGTNVINGAVDNLDKVMGGDFDLADIQKGNMKSLALANKMAPKISATALSKKQSPKQEALASALSEFIPPTNARLVSGASGGDTSMASSLAGTDPVKNLGQELQEKIAEKSKDVEYESKSKTSQKVSDEPDFKMPDFGFKAESKEDPGTEVLTFADQAVSKADVSNAPQTPIFDIISNRYRRSWDKFEATPEPVKE